jgi:CDP-diacylglycerol--serine O-phosphatidyltransferase
MVLPKLKLVSIADVLTICNGICGILAIISFIWYYPDITIGTGLIFLGIVFDGMDGAAARKFGTKHDFGRHLDSISDAFTFCLAPAVLVISVFYLLPENEQFFNTAVLVRPRNILVFLTSAMVVVFGLRRLTIFTISGYKLQTFLGLATPALAFYIIVISHILDPHRSENEAEYLAYFSLISILFGSLLMGANIRYPKIRGWLGAILAITIILSILSIQVQKWFNLSSYEDIFIYYRIMSFFGLGIVISYVFISPLFLLSQTDKNKK